MAVLPTQYEAAFLAVLPMGREHAITARELGLLMAQHAGHVVDERTVRQIASDLRRRRFPICSAVRKPWGFLPADQRERGRGRHDACLQQGARGQDYREGVPCDHQGLEAQRDDRHDSGFAWDGGGCVMIGATQADRMLYMAHVMSAMRIKLECHRPMPDDHGEGARTWASVYQVVCWAEQFLLQEQRRAS